MNDSGRRKSRFVSVVASATGSLTSSQNNPVKKLQHINFDTPKEADDLRFCETLNPRMVALSLVQRLGQRGLDAFENAVRSCGIGGCTGDQFVYLAICMLNDAEHNSEACCYPWEKKVDEVGGLESSASPFSADLGDGDVQGNSEGGLSLQASSHDYVSQEPMAEGSSNVGSDRESSPRGPSSRTRMVDSVGLKNSGIHFINTIDHSKGFQYFTDRSQHVVKRQDWMGRFLQSEAAKAPTSLFDKQGTLRYAMSLLYQEIDERGKDLVTWDEFQTFISDVVLRGDTGTEVSLISEYARKNERPVTRFAPRGISKILHVPNQRYIVATEDRQLLCAASRSLRVRVEYSTTQDYGPVNALAYVPRSYEGPSVSAVFGDNFLRMYNESTAALRYSCQLPTQQVSLKYMDPLQALLIGSRNGVVHKVDLSFTNYTPQMLAAVHSGAITDMLFLQKEQQLVTCSTDWCSKYIDIGTGATVATMLHKHGINCLAHNPHYSVVMTAGVGPAPCMAVPGDRGALLRSFQYKDDHPAIHPIVKLHCVDSSPQVISFDQGGNVKVWDLRTLNCVQHIRPLPKNSRNYYGRSFEFFDTPVRHFQTYSRDSIEYFVYSGGTVSRAEDGELDGRACVYGCDLDEDRVVTAVGRDIKIDYYSEKDVNKKEDREQNVPTEIARRQKCMETMTIAEMDDLEMDLDDGTTRRAMAVVTVVTTISDQHLVVAGCEDGTVGIFRSDIPDLQDAIQKRPIRVDQVFHSAVMSMHRYPVPENGPLVAVASMNEVKMLNFLTGEVFSFLDRPVSNITSFDLWKMPLEDRYTDIMQNNVAVALGHPNNVCELFIIHRILLKEVPLKHSPSQNFFFSVENLPEPELTMAINEDERVFIDEADYDGTPFDTETDFHIQLQNTIKYAVVTCTAPLPGTQAVAVGSSLGGVYIWCIAKGYISCVCRFVACDVGPSKYVGGCVNIQYQTKNALLYVALDTNAVVVYDMEHVFRVVFPPKWDVQHDQQTVIVAPPSTAVAETMFAKRSTPHDLRAKLSNFRPPSVPPTPTIAHTFTTSVKGRTSSFLLVPDKNAIVVAGSNKREVHVYSLWGEMQKKTDGTLATPADFMAMGLDSDVPYPWGTFGMQDAEDSFHTVASLNARSTMGRSSKKHSVFANDSMNRQPRRKSSMSGSMGRRSIMNRKSSHFRYARMLDSLLDEHPGEEGSTRLSVSGGGTTQRPSVAYSDSFFDDEDDDIVAFMPKRIPTAHLECSSRNTRFGANALMRSKVDRLPESLGNVKERFAGLVPRRDSQVIQPEDISGLVKETGEGASEEGSSIAGTPIGPGQEAQHLTPGSSALAAETTRRPDSAQSRMTMDSNMSVNIGQRLAPSGLGGTPPRPVSAMSLPSSVELQKTAHLSVAGLITAHSSSPVSQRVNHQVKSDLYWSNESRWAGGNPDATSLRRAIFLHNAKQDRHTSKRRHIKNVLDQSLQRNTRA